jgi:uncharacterized spore protein YtfJ
VVGEPVKAGSVTVIPILMVDVSFGGGGTATPSNPAGAAAQSSGSGLDGFFMSGQGRPLGFVVIDKKGTRFISIGKVPGKRGD